MRGRLAAIAIAIAVALAAPRASADEPSAAALQSARGHFRTGQALYESKRYREALREFVAGYGLSRRPAFLLNMAQCYRALGALGQARELYQQFVQVAPPDQPPAHTERSGAAQVLKQVEREIDLRGPGPRITDDKEEPKVVVKERVVTHLVAAPPAPPAWYTSRFGWSFVVIGAVGLIGGAGLLAGAEGEVASATTAPTRNDFLSGRDRAELFRDIGIGALAVGGVALIVGVSGFGAAARRNRVHPGALIVPTLGGAMAVGTF